MINFSHSSTLTDDLIKWLCSQLLLSGKAGYVLGVSGGIDSIVSAMLCNEACKSLKKKLKLMSLPINDTNVIENNDSLKDLFKNQGITIECVDLSNIYYEFKKICLSDLPATAWPTIKHRIRLTYIYTIAKRDNLLVVGTVNAVEFNIGYFAKWSGLGDVLPLAKLTKCQIRNIAREMGFEEQIVSQKASGCVEGGFAEDEWGFSEEEADKLIGGYKNSVRKEAREAFDKMVNESTHKRSFVPIFNPKQ